MAYKKINLDEVSKLHNKRHADYLLYNDDIIIVVEETGRPEFRDLEKICETINYVKSGVLDDYIDIIQSKSLIIGILHRKKGDTMVSKYIYFNRKELNIKVIACNKDFDKFLHNLRKGRIQRDN